MAYDPVSHKIVMFGGYGGYGYFNDTWTFDGAIWKRQKTAAPSSRAAPSKELSPSEDFPVQT